MNFGDRAEMQVAYSGAGSLVAALQSSSTRSRALASADLDSDGAPDLIAGYELDGKGIVTVQRGNADAFAPKDEAVFELMQKGYNPHSLLPTAQTYQIPEPADFLLAGDFNNDSRTDVLVGAQGGDLFLLAGDGQGNLDEPVQITLSGVVTAVAAGQFRAPDGRIDLAVGIVGPSGPQMLIYDGADGVTGEPMRLALPSPATALEFGEVDDSPFMGLAIATGTEINVIHGWGRKQTPQLESRVERIDTGMNVRGLASGFFMWSREGSNQLAALGDDGTIRIFGRGELNTQPLTDQELTARARLRLQPKDTTKVDVETLSGWQAAKGEPWTKARELVTGNFVGAGATTRNLLRAAHISFTGTDDLMVLGGSSKLDIVRHVDTTKSAPASANLIGGDFTTTSLESADPAATLALPQKLNGWRDLLVMEAGSVAVTVVPLAPTATITVDRIDDPSGPALTAASACTGAANDCSLRGAVQFANANAGTVISLGSNTYTLNINGNGGCVRESAATGNTIGDLEVNQTTTIMGTGQASTIINQTGTGTGPTFTGDRVLCMDVPLTAGLTFTFSGLTVAGGRDVASGVGGGGFIGGAKNTTLNLTNVTFANNQTSPGVPQGPAGGGGVAVTGGNMNVTNCTFGAANLPGASRTDTTLGNAAISLSGGGLSYSAGDPLGTSGATGTLTITGTTFTHNTSSSVSNGGAGFDVYDFNVSVGTANISSSAFTSNQATGTASGGGIFNHGVNSLTIATTSFTSNSAGNRGGGMYVGGGLGTVLNGTTPSIVFSNNTAGTAGSSISAAGGVTVSGTNTTIGGDLEITTNGIWTNSAGSAISPTNFIMTGTANFMGNNSTTNVGGNFNFGSGTFNAGTSTFNFNGAIAQSITNSSPITFFNLTDSNTTQPLTLNNSFAVNGTLNINGANAIFDPVATPVISGTGTLTGTGTARVSRTAATADFLSQYTITNKTLTNLTVEYIGAAVQTGSAITYGNLKINNASGVNLAAGTATVNGTLTLQTGALGVGTSTLVINNGTTVVGGSLTSGATGLVNYNQGSAGQSVIAGIYGNLTFSAFTKVLASTGTIGIAGTFNPNGVTSGHTITGSTIDFNGTGAQTVPVFNYNNLTMSGARGGATVTLAAGTFGVAGTFNPSATAVVYSFTGNTFDFNGTGAQTVPVFNYNNLTISGNRGAAAITLASGNIGIAGIFNPSVTNNSFVTTGNTVIFNGSVAQTIPAFAFFNGLTLNNAAGASLGGNVTVGGALTLTTGALAVGTNTLMLNGAVSATAGSLTSGATGTVIYNQGSNGQATVLAANYGNLTFSNFSKTLAGSGTIGIAGVFTPGTGTGHTIAGSTINFNGASAQTIPGFTYNNLTSSGGVAARTLDPVNTIKIAAVFTPGTNVYTITGSTVEYNGSAAQTLPATFITYNNLTLNNPTTVLGFAGLTVQGLLRVQAGTFTSSSNYNNVQIDPGATMVATAASSISIGGNWTNSGTFTPSTGTVVFNGNNNTQTLSGNTTFNNLTINYTGTGTVTAAGSTLAVSGLLRVQEGTFISSSTFNNVQIDSGQTLQGTNGTTMNVSGNWTNNGGTFTPNGNTVNFNGGGAQSIGGSATTQNFDNFIVNKGGASTLSVAASTNTLDINGNVTLTLGTFAAGTATAITVAGNWTNNGGAFTPGTGTVTFDGGAGQAIGGTTSTTFNNLTSANANGLAMSNDNTVNGILALASSDITVASTKTLTQPSSAPASQGTGDVIGNTKRSNGGVLPTGTALTFGNPNVSINFASVTALTDVNINLVKSVPTGTGAFSTAVQRTYTITPTGGGTFSATLRLHYLDSELNGNTEGAGLKLWRFNGVSLWTPFANTGFDTTDNWAERSGVTLFSPWTLNSSGPTDVRLDAFAAIGYDGGTLIEWRTGFEVDNLGFNLYRDEGGKRVPVNSQMVAGSALVAGYGVTLRAGQSYAWWDGAASKLGAQYWLESIDLKGQSEWHGPFSSRFVGGVRPARGNSSMLGRAGNAQAGLTLPLERAALPKTGALGQIALQSGLAGQAAVKMWVKREGFYRVTGSELAEVGLDPRADSSLLQLYADGEQIPINVISDKDGLLSAIEFYGRGLDAAFTDQRVYWLVSGAQPGLRIKQVKGAGLPTAAQSFLDIVERKDRTIYFSSLRNGERENFFGAVIAATPVDQSLTLQHVDQSAAGAAIIEVALQGVTTLPHKVSVYLNEAFAGEVSFDGQIEAISRFTVAQSLLRSGDNQLRFVAQAGPSDISLVDYIRLSYWHSFVADGDSLRLTVPGNREVTIGGFSNGAIRVLDVTDPDSVQELRAKIEMQKAGGFAVTVASPGGERRLLAIANGQSSSVVRIAANQVSGWRAAANAADLVMIAPREFFSAIEPLRALRSKQGLKVELADIEDVFDEFSFGNKSPQAMKDFLQYATTRWKIKPRFVLLVGDASYDAKNYLGLGDSDLIPTRLVDTSLMETASDDWLADFNADGIADLAVGRLAARTPAEASAMVRKITGYENSEPLESMLLVADVNNGFDFETAATQLRALIPGNLRVEQINRGQVGDVTAKSRLIDAITRGQKVVNYMGHGSVNLWSGSLLTNEDAGNLTNGERLPLFVMMTCLNGYFHDPALDSLAESLLKAENGGAVAVWTSTGMTLPADQLVLNEQLYQLLFGSGNGMTLGEATARAKAAVTDVDIRRTWVLLGDPTMRLK